MRYRVGIAAAFTVAFTLSSLSFFAVLYFGGTAMLVAETNTMHWLYALAGLLLLALAGVDIVSIRKRSYCPLSWRRQTAKRLIRRFTVPVVAAAWGFDAGLAFTTFRVTAITWGVLLLAVCGLCPWWIGMGYGLGFAIPWLVLVCTQPPNPAVQIVAKHKMRGPVQAVSALLLATTGLILLAGLI
jgi:hypothetical protein